MCLYFPRKTTEVNNFLLGLSGNRRDTVMGGVNILSLMSEMESEEEESDIEEEAGGRTLTFNWTFDHSHSLVLPFIYI